MKCVSSVSVAGVLLGAAVRAAEEGATHVSALSEDVMSEVFSEQSDLWCNARLVCKHWMSLINREFCAQIIGKPALSDLNREDCSAGIIRCRSIGDLKHAASLANARKIPITPLWRGLPVCYREIRGPNPGCSSEEIRLCLHSEMPAEVPGESRIFWSNSQPLMDDKVIFSLNSNLKLKPQTLNVKSGEVEDIQYPCIKESLKKHGVNEESVGFRFNLQNIMGKTDEWIGYSCEKYEISYLKYNPDQDRVTRVKFFSEPIQPLAYLSDDQSTMLACEQYKDKHCMVAHVIDTRMNQIKRTIFLPFLNYLLGNGPQIKLPWVLFKGALESPINLINLETGDRIRLDRTVRRYSIQWINDELFHIKAGFRTPHCIRSVKDPHSDLVQFNSLLVEEDEVRLNLGSSGACDVTIVAENLIATKSHFIDVETFNPPDKENEEHKAIKQPNHHWQLAKISLVMCVPLFILTANQA